MKSKKITIKNIKEEYQFYEGMMYWLLGDINFVPKTNEIYKTSIKRGIRKGDKFSINFAGTHELYEGNVSIKTINKTEYFGQLSYIDHDDTYKVNLRFYENEAEAGVIFIGLLVEE